MSLPYTSRLPTSFVDCSTVDEVLIRTITAGLRQDGIVFIEHVRDSSQLERVASLLGTLEMARRPVDTTATTTSSIVLRKDVASEPQSSSQGYTSEALFLHTDRSSSLGRPPDILLTALHVPAVSGGESTFCDMGAVYEHMAQHHPGLLHHYMTEKFVFQYRDVLGCHLLFDPQAGSHRTIAARFRHDAQLYVPATLLDQHAAFLALLETHTHTTSFMAGQGYILNNGWWLHGRTRYEGIDRCLWRCLVHSNPLHGVNWGFPQVKYTTAVPDSPAQREESLQCVQPYRPTPACRGTVLLIGNLLAEMHPSHDATNFRLAVGGSAGISAVTLAKLGVSVRLISAVGHDLLGERLLHELTVAGVDTSGVFVSNHQKTPFSIARMLDTDHATVKVFDSYLFRGHCNPVEELVQHEMGIDTAVDVVDFTEASIRSDDLREAVFAAVVAARRRGTFIVFAANLRRHAWPSDREDDAIRVVLCSAVSRSDVVVCNEEELVFLTSQQSPTTGSIDQRLVFALMARLQQHTGVRVVITTRGPQSVLVRCSNEQRVIAVPPIQVAVEIGAGDAFHAGVLYSLIRLHDNGNAMRSVGADEWGGVIGDATAVAAAHVCGEPIKLLRRPRLILFDIDGTLVHAAEISVLAFESALGELLGRAVSLAANFPSIALHGRTDFGLAESMFLALGVERERVPSMIKSFLDLLPRHLQQAMEDKVTKKPIACVGATALIAYLHQRRERDVPEYTIGLLTGNSQPTALIKLSAAGFDVDHFDLSHSAFGSSCSNRSDLVAVAVVDPSRWSRIVIVGDTPADVRCAKDNAAVAVAVATGSFTESELADHQPDVLLADLNSCVEVVRMLLSC